MSEQPVLHWDGSTLHGSCAGRQAVVTVAARLAAFHSETLPPATVPELRAAARLKAARVFAAIGPVAVDGVIAPAAGRACPYLLIAVPQTVVAAVRSALAARGQVLAVLRIAELCAPIGPGGLVEAHGEAALVAVRDGQLVALAALGSASAPGLTAALERERLRLGIAPDAPSAPPIAPRLDLLRPVISEPPTLLERRGVRVGLLVAGLVVLIAAAAGLTAWDAVAERAAAQAELERLRPLAATISARRADLAEVAPWFDARPSSVPALRVLAEALPDDGGQVRLIRVRQEPGAESVAEINAGDRAQMLAFVERLRRDPRIAVAQIRASRNPSRDSRAVIFELVIRLTGAAHAAS
jgi:hypothetical protein